MMQRYRISNRNERKSVFEIAFKHTMTISDLNECPDYSPTYYFASYYIVLKGYLKNQRGSLVLYILMSVFPTRD